MSKGERCGCVDRDQKGAWAGGGGGGGGGGGSSGSREVQGQKMKKKWGKILKRKGKNEEGGEE